MKNINKIINILFFTLLFILPAFTNSAVTGNQPPSGGSSSNTGITYECVQIGAGPKDANGNPTDIYGNCGFNDLILGVRKFFSVTIPLALGFSVIVIAYAGFLYMTSGSNPGQRTQANKMFISIGWGVFFMLAAWLIVTLILNALTDPNVVPRLLN